MQILPFQHKKYTLEQIEKHLLEINTCIRSRARRREHNLQHIRRWGPAGVGVALTGMERMQRGGREKMEAHPRTIPHHRQQSQATVVVEAATNRQSGGPAGRTGDVTQTEGGQIAPAWRGDGEDAESRQREDGDDAERRWADGAGGTDVQRRWRGRREYAERRWR